MMFLHFLLLKRFILLFVIELVKIYFDSQCTNPVSLKHFSKAEMKGVYISYTNNEPSFVGIDSIKIVAQDETGTFSDVVTVTVVVMENKCQHGYCISKF